MPADVRQLPTLTGLEIRGAINHGRLGGEGEVYELLDGRLFRACAPEAASTAFPGRVGVKPVPLQPVMLVVAP